MSECLEDNWIGMRSGKEVVCIFKEDFYYELESLV